MTSKSSATGAQAGAGDGKDANNGAAEGRDVKTISQEELEAANRLPGDKPIPAADPGKSAEAHAANAAKHADRAEDALRASRGVLEEAKGAAIRASQPENATVSSAGQFAGLASKSADRAEAAAKAVLSTSGALDSLAAVPADTLMALAAVDALLRDKGHSLEALLMKMAHQTLGVVPDKNRSVPQGR